MESLDFDDEAQPETSKAPKKRFRKNKLKLVFDSDERKKFLQGFRKRKQDRKEEYVKKLERDLAKEKKRIKEQTQRAVKKLSSSHSVLPEVKNIIDSIPEKEETYDLGNTLVKITSLDDQVYRNLPTIKEEDEDEEESESEDEGLRARRAKANFVLTDDEDGEEYDLQKVVKTDPFFNPINDDEMDDYMCSDDEKEVPYNPLEMLRRNTERAEVPPDQKNMSKAKLEREANRMLMQSDAFKKIQKLKQKKSKKFKMFRLQPTEDAGGAEGGVSAKSKAGKGKKKSNNVLKSKHAQSQKRGKNRK